MVHTRCVDGHSAAQNMNPRAPLVVPAPAGATVFTQLPVEFSSDELKVVHSGAGLVPVTIYKLTASLAGASGGTGGE